VTEPSDPSLRHLSGRLSVVEARVAAAVARCRGGDPGALDRFQGLFLSSVSLDRLLAVRRSGTGEVEPEVEDFLTRVEAEADGAEAAGADLRLRRLARAFGLDAYDTEVLLVALAPDLDPRFERFYAYLHDEVHRKRASTGLAFDLCGAGFGASDQRWRLGSEGPLAAGGLVCVEESERPFLTRSLRVPDRVAAFLLGDDTPDRAVAEMAAGWVQIDTVTPQVLTARLSYLREQPGAAAQAAAASALASAGRPPVVLDLGRLDRGDDAAILAAVAVREARLCGGALVAGPVEVLAERGPADVRAFAEAPCPVVLYGARAWDPLWSKEVPLLLEAPQPSGAQREAVWSAALNGDTPLDATTATVGFRLNPEQVVRAAVAAQRQAGAEERPVAAADLQAGARAQNAAGLERLARRVEPRAAWPDLVLPPVVVGQLSDLVDRTRFRERVLDGWGMGERSSRGRGITALFAGESGTGKTLSAEVLAGQLGLDLYVIDLSTVVDKYIGETEKHLDRIFAEADRVNGVLLFDEADALFGKRSDVRDSHDRYANVEVAYLLQRMERFDGLAFLTTNLRSNLDDAFTRRLDAIVDFPMPDETDRLRLWDLHLRPGVPRAAEVDLPFLAQRFRISGGNIRNIALAASFRAAAADRPVEMADLIRATEGEYRKLGHLCVEAEFGPYYPLVATPR
jgi:hypothetical protein